MAAQRSTTAEAASQGSPGPGPAPSKLDRYLDEQEDGSFPASDPHSDWSGPPAWLHEPPGAVRPDGSRQAAEPAP